MWRAARLWAVPLAGLMATGVWADVVRLQNGQVIEGDLKRTDKGWIVTKPDGQKVEIPAEQVQRVELKPSTAEGPRGEALALSRLESLRRSVESAEDIGWILSRYDEFLAQYKNSLAAEKAAIDRQRWKERADQGLVRLGDQWVTPQRRTELQIEATSQAAEARQLIKLGQMAEARELLTQALRTDPKNVTALYLKGLLDYQQNELSSARRALETAQAQLEDHAATLNNLAIIAWRQNRTGDALALYDRAMAAAPENELILQNVAEALNGLAKDDQNTPIAQRTHRRFVEQDKRLQEKMQAEGRYRWGSQYVSKAEFDALQSKEQEIRQQLDAMATQFADAEAKLTDIDNRIAANERMLRQIEADTYLRSWDGFLYRAPLPPVYYEILRDNDQLRRQRLSAVTELDRLRVRAREVQRQIPRPKFTGEQTPFGVEGTPLAAPLAIAEAPAAAPAPEAGPVAEAVAAQEESVVEIGPPRKPATQPVD